MRRVLAILVVPMLAGAAGCASYQPAAPMAKTRSAMQLTDCSPPSPESPSCENPPPPPSCTPPPPPCTPQNCSSSCMPNWAYCADPPVTEPSDPNCNNCNYEVTLLCNENSPVPTIAATCPSPTPCDLARDTPSSANFAVIGDWGDQICVPSCSTVVSTMVNLWDAKYGIDFIVTTGDNNYPNGNGANLTTNLNLYSTWAPPPTLPPGYVPRFFPTLGNHDIYTSCGQPYLDRFAHLAATSSSGNARYYNYAVPEPAGVIEIFSINSNNTEQDGIGVNCPQALWLKSALAASGARWKIVIFHEPPMGTSGIDGYNAPLLWPFKQWGASIVLMGHKHLYERIESCGIPWITNGLGGTKGIGSFNGCTPVPGSRLRFNQSVGAMIGVASKDQLTFCFVAATADNPEGACIDRFMVN